jgi:hypothetical protein
MLLAKELKLLTKKSLSLEKLTLAHVSGFFCGFDYAQPPKSQIHNTTSHLIVKQAGALLSARVQKIIW